MKQSIMLRDLLEDADWSQKVEIALEYQFITDEILGEVIQYCEFASRNHPPKIQKPIRHSSIYDITSPWYATFAQKYENDRLCEFILAANYLNI